jgi:anti-sigma regulatory factor (Ser/Thr protein kinase)
MIQSFTFNNEAAHISAFTREILAHMEPLLAERGKARALLLRAKFIIAELLNNAVKHSGTQHTILTIEMQEKSLLISKTDSGAPFNLIGKLEQQDEQLMVSSDAMHLLYAVRRDDATVSFYCKENLTFDYNQSGR